MKAIRTVLACIRKADQKYNLINHGDKIVIGLSGGKDSLALTYALTLYHKFSHTDFVIQPVILDLGFDRFDSSKLSAWCESLGLKLIVNDSKEVYKILLAAQDDHKHLPCSICSKMKKAAINKVANDLGFNKVAFAHHADDAIETLLMNEIYGGRVATFSPKMHLEKADITFIRPLSLVRESDIVRLCKEENLPVMDSICPADKHTTREDIKVLLENIYKQYPFAKENFLTMLDNYEKQDIWDKEVFHQVNQCGLTLKPVLSAMDANILHELRYEVFVKEMGISMEDEFILEEEKQAYSYIVYSKDVPVGTIRYRIFENGIKLERITVKKEYRHQKIASQVITFLSDYIGMKYNPCRVYLHAMYHLKDFYTSLGFKIKGSPFMEANIKHIEVERYY